MKRVLAFLAAASALLMVSCTKELNKFDGNTGGLQKVSFKVSTEGAITKAVSFGSGNLAGAADTGELIVQAFVLGSDNKYTLMPNAKITISNPNAGKWDVDLQLAKGETYRIAFWAQKKETGIYNTADLSAVTVDYSKVAINSDNADAFCATRELKVTGTLSEVVELKRPLAQINVGTNDRAVYNNSVPEAKQALSGKVTLSEGVPSKINLIGATTAVEGVVAYTVTGETEAETVFGPTAANGADETIGEHNNLFMLYVLADPERQMMDFSVAIENAVNPMCKIDVSNLPFRANYRTNILGQLLTGDVHYDVEIVPLFNTPDYDKLVEPGFASVSALNTYLATMLDQTCEGDNGDIDPEVVILKADATMSDKEEIFLPKIAGKIVLRILPECKKITLKYAEGATDAQKPANVDLYLTWADTLVISLDASHVELLACSALDAAVVTTGPGTFVIQNGAKVGKATIKQGNAQVEGEVAKIIVDEEASADGQGAPVEIKLEKEAAVEKIILNAPTDVVVEQPKDNIDESNTENKVEVQVNVNDCSATAQNGGQIYVKVGAGVTCEVIADGEDSAAKVGEAGEGAIIDAQTNDGGKIETTPDTAGAIKYYVAQIGETKYETIEEAVDAVKDGETIIVLSDITQDDGILYNKANVSAKLDLNNKTITINKGSNVNSRAIRIDNGTLEVFDGSIIAVGAGTNSSNGTGCYGAFRVEANGALDAHDLDLKNSRPWGLNVKVLGGTATLTNVNITSSYGGGIEVTEADLGNKSQIGTATLTNCNFTQTGYFDHCSSTLSVSGGSELTINGGTYTSDNYALYVFSSGGVIIVNDGTFSGNKNGIAIIAAIDTNTYPEYTGGLQIKGGSFSGGFSITSPAYMEVTGGTFSADPSAFVPKATHHVETVTINNETWYAVLEGVDYIFEDGVVTVNTAFGLSYVSQNYADFRDEQHNLTIKLNNDINMTGKAFNSFNVNNYTSAQKEIVLFTFDGQNHTITGMENMLIASTWAGKSAVDVKDLTIADSYIVEDENDSEGTVGVGAICGWPQASQYFYMTNVHVINSSIIGGHWTGGLVGIASGYDNPSDGPVKEGIIVTGCSVEGCTIKGKGSAGSLVGHAAANEATTWEITDFTAINNDVLNSGTNTDRTGALIGTLGTTRGVSTAYPDAKVGVYFTSPLVVSGNKVLGVVNDDKKVGRKGSYDDDKVFLDGVNVVEEWLGN